MFSDVVMLVIMYVVTTELLVKNTYNIYLLFRA